MFLFREILLLNVLILNINCNGLQTFRLTPVDEFSVPEKSEVYETKDNFLTPFWDNFEGPQQDLDLVKFDSKDLLLQPFCPISNEACSKNEPFRRVNGYCNNKEVPMFGSSGDIFTRLLAPIYDYGIMRIKSASGNGILPNPRIVSNGMKSMRRRMDPKNVNILWLFFGQFLDHDMTVTPLALGKFKISIYSFADNSAVIINLFSEFSEGKDTRVCEDCGSWKINTACAPILIPKNDDSIPYILTNGKRKCLPFVRSNAVPSSYQNKPALEQLNFNTAYIDLSVVYGSERCTERQLRLFRFGQLVEERHPLDFKGMLPTRPIEPFRDCRSRSGRCPKAGDIRALENLAIHIIHVAFLREHNRIARKLLAINKHWNDERIYQEARRINIAQYQKIVYEEFLPILLGEKLMKLYKLYPLSTRTYFKENFLDNMARGMAATNVEPVDPVIQSSLTDKLFIKNKNPFTSQDLISLNIARARDHGIPGYTAYRHICGLSRIHNWDDMEIFPEDLNILKRIYSSVHDVDLFVGGLAELPQDDGIIGPTFGCIVSQQFLRLKIGDNFWFENENNNLTLEQLQTIKESSGMSRILLLNFGSSLYLPKRIFNVPDKQKNPLESSTMVKDINFSLWEEKVTVSNTYCQFKGEIFSIYEKVSISPCLKCNCDSSAKISCEWIYENCP
ncbi:Peroxidase skpo-1 [Armadillidium vulgare]|nr:Peroxidase skpo-1 [Armadillidium vulgare]